MKRVYCIVILAFITSHIALSQNWIWGRGEKNLNSKSNAYVSGIAADAAGDIYLTGGYWGVDIYGTDTLSYGGKTGNAFLVKYDANGNVLWTRNSILLNTSTYSAWVNALCIDKSGYVYIGGYVNGSAVFGSDTVSGVGFLAKYDSSGRPIWAKSFSPIESLTTDVTGNVYIVFMYTADIEKCDSSGHMIWFRTIPAPKGGYGEGNSVVTDNSGNVYFGGLFDRELILGKDTLHGDTLFYDAFITKYDTAGNEIWAKSGIGSYQCQCNSLATDNSGNIYMTGIFQDSMYIGSYGFASGPKGNVFLVKYTPNGNIIWAEDAVLKGSTGYDLADGYSVCVDKEQDVYLSGTFEDTMTMGGATLVIGNSNWYGSDPAFIYKFDSSGHALCATSVGRDQDDYCGVVVDPFSNDIYFSGDAFYLTTCTFGSDTLNGGGEDYSFLAKWQPCNSPQGVNELPGSNNEIRIYPNPSSGVFTIKSSSSQSSSVEIYNMLGEGIYTRRINSESTQIDLNSQPSGIYLYRITSEKGEPITSGKLVIQ